jgi:hypothetical protein
VNIFGGGNLDIDLESRQLEVTVGFHWTYGRSDIAAAESEICSR